MLKKIKFAVVLGVILHSTFFYAQEKKSNEIQYSSDEVQTFITIYEYKLNHPFEIATSMQNSFKQTTISEERMTEILQAQFAGNEIKLSEKEKSELEKIKALMEVDKAKYDALLNTFILENKMKPNRFKEIEDALNNNIEFQNKSVLLQKK